METASLNADKCRSYSTLNTLYHESRQEMELLNKQMTLKDNTITELKTRLSRYERTRVMVGDNESVVVGPSKSLLESLCKEICKLKQKSNDAELKASKHAAEIQQLNSQLKAKDVELERIQHQPDHEKDREIHQLRSDLEKRERRDATRAVLYSSLAEEADQLRGQLAATVKVCQELLARLEKEKTEGGAQQLGEEFTESSERRDVKLVIAQLQEENRQLKQRVTYVQGLNTQWQKYDSSREDYIQGLCQRLKETTSQGMVPCLGTVSTGMLRHEISRLNGLLKEKVVECAQLEREVEDVRRQDREHIQMLEQQVLIYTEDFKSERADRERAQSQIQELKEKIHLLKQHVHKQQAAGSEHCEAAPLCRVHIGHRISSRRHRESAERLLTTNCEIQQQPPAVRALSQNLARSDDVGLSELQCPRCLTIFNDTDAAEYLNHCEECAKL